MLTPLTMTKAAAEQLIIDHPWVHIEVWRDHLSDLIMVGAVNVKKNNGTYIRPLLSRHEIESGQWIAIARDRFGEAISAVTTSPSVE